MNYFMLCMLLLGSDDAPGKSLAEDPFLRPYVEQLKKTTSAADLRRITARSKSELITLHHGYGTGIRNRWLRGDRDPELVRFFRANKIADPDEMSMVIIEALWLDLNRGLNPEGRKSVEAKRKIVARKRATYEKLESECKTQLEEARIEIERCYVRHGLPTKHISPPLPFFDLRVDKSGHIREIRFFDDASPELKDSLTKLINKFTFSSFSDEEFVTLYITEFPRCRVAERDTLHQ